MLGMFRLEEVSVDKHESPESGRREVETERYCLKCRKETPFVLTYAEGYLIKSRCKECGTVTQDKKLLAKVFIEDLIDRGFEAAKRETKAVIHDPAAEAKRLPKRVIEKSVKILRQIKNIFGE